MSFIDCGFIIWKAIAKKASGRENAIFALLTPKPARKSKTRNLFFLRFDGAGYILEKKQK